MVIYYGIFLNIRAKRKLHALNIKEVLEETDYLIYSTKRLSDGEIFTIGDLDTKNHIRIGKLTPGWIE